MFSKTRKHLRCNLLFGLIGHSGLLKDVNISFFLSFFSIFSLSLFIILALQGGPILSVPPRGSILSVSLEANKAFQFAFAGDGIQDTRALLVAFEHHAISIGRMIDIEKLPLLVATFYGRARDWYESLLPNQQVNYHLLVKQFKAEYIRCWNAMKVWQELFHLRTSSTMEYTDYEREFIDLWTTWIRLRVKRSMNVLRWTASKPD